MPCEAFPPPFHPTALIIARCHLQPPFVIGLCRSCHNHQGLPFSNSAFYRPADGPICSKWSQELPWPHLHCLQNCLSASFSARFSFASFALKTNPLLYRFCPLLFCHDKIWKLIGEEYIIIVSSCSDHEWQGIVGKTQKIAAPSCWLNYRPESGHFEPSPMMCYCPLKDADSDESGTRGFRWPWTLDLAFSLYSPATTLSIGKQCDFCQYYSSQY